MKLKHILLSTAAFSTLASAQVTITNAGFELGNRDVAETDGHYTMDSANNSLTGWDTTEDSIRQGAFTRASNIFYGTQLSTAPNFTGTYAFGHQLNNTSPTNSMTTTQTLGAGGAGFYTVSLNYFLRGFQTTGVGINLVMNGTTIASLSNLNPTSNQSGTITGVYQATSAFASGSLSFNTTSTNSDSVVAYDNMTVTHSLVPEPSAALLGAFGALALLRRRRA